MSSWCQILLCPGFSCLADASWLVMGTQRHNGKWPYCSLLNGSLKMGKKKSIAWPATKSCRSVCGCHVGIPATESPTLGPLALLTYPQIDVLLFTGRRPPVGDRHVLGIVGGTAMQEQDPPGALLLLQPVQQHLYLETCQPIKGQHPSSCDLPLLGNLVCVCVL